MYRSKIISKDRAVFALNLILIPITPEPLLPIVSLSEDVPRTARDAKADAEARDANDQQLMSTARRVAFKKRGRKANRTETDEKMGELMQQLKSTSEKEDRKLSNQLLEDWGVCTSKVVELIDAQQLEWDGRKTTKEWQQSIMMMSPDDPRAPATRILYGRIKTTPPLFIAQTALDTWMAACHDADDLPSPRAAAVSNYDAMLNQSPGPLRKQYQSRRSQRQKRKSFSISSQWSSSNRIGHTVHYSFADAKPIRRADVEKEPLMLIANGDIVQMLFEHAEHFTNAFVQSEIMKTAIAVKKCGFVIDSGIHLQQLGVSPDISKVIEEFISKGTVAFEFQGDPVGNGVLVGGHPYEGGHYKTTADPFHTKNPAPQSNGQRVRDKEPKRDSRKPTAVARVKATSSATATSRTVAAAKARARPRTTSTATATSTAVAAAKARARPRVTSTATATSPTVAAAKARASSTATSTAMATSTAVAAANARGKSTAQNEAPINQLLFDHLITAWRKEQGKPNIAEDFRRVLRIVKASPVKVDCFETLNAQSPQKRWTTRSTVGKVLVAFWKQNKFVPRLIPKPPANLRKWKLELTSPIGQRSLKQIIIAELKQHPETGLNLDLLELYIRKKVEHSLLYKEWSEVVSTLKLFLHHCPEFQLGKEGDWFLKK